MPKNYYSNKKPNSSNKKNYHSNKYTLLNKYLKKSNYKIKNFMKSLLNKKKPSKTLLPSNKLSNNIFYNCNPPIPN